MFTLQINTIDTPKHLLHHLNPNNDSNSNSSNPTELQGIAHLFRYLPTTTTTAMSIPSSNTIARTTLLCGRLATVTAIDVLEQNPDLITKLRKNITILCRGLSDIRGLEIVSDPQSPIVFLRLKKSTGSSKNDLSLLEDISHRLLKEDSIFMVTSKISMLDKYSLPVGIRLFVSTADTKSDLTKACESLKIVASLVLTTHE